MDNNELWQCVLSDIELNVNKTTFNTWFKRTCIESKDGGTITVSAPNAFAREWLENKFAKFILKSLRNLNSEIKEVKFTISSSANNPIQKTDQKISQKNHKPQINQSNQLNFTNLNNNDSNLNDKYVFESYIVGSSNELAYAAARSITKNLGSMYNPLFIYGGVGLGKTHLIQSIGNEVLKDNPEKKVKYVSSEKFASELITAIQRGEMEKFKNKYRQIDLLIIDDIQFLSGKEKTQEEFFHTFNTLYEKNKQIIISSDRPPQAIQTLEDRLRSRFEGGMIADISYPDIETRTAILKSKIAKKGVNLSDEVISYIVNNFKNNIRELEGALNKVIIHLNIAKDQEINIATIERILSSEKNMPKKIINSKQILKIVSNFYDIEEKQMLLRVRKQEIVKPRQIAMFLLRSECKASFPAIGSKMGGRDHTTVIHACNKIKEDLKSDNILAEEINIIKQRLYA